jgi:hypothetical protein
MGRRVDRQHQVDVDATRFAARHGDESQDQHQGEREAARGERHLLQRGRRMWQNSRDGGEA